MNNQTINPARIEDVREQIRTAFTVAKAIREVEQLDFIDLFNLTGFNHYADSQRVKEAWVKWMHEIMEEDPETGQASPELATLIQYRSWRDAWKHLCRSGRWAAIRDMVDPIGSRKTVIRFPLSTGRNVEGMRVQVENLSEKVKVNRYKLAELYAQLLAFEMRLRTEAQWLENIPIREGWIFYAKKLVREHLEEWGDWQCFAFVFDPNVQSIRVFHPNPCGNVDKYDDTPRTAAVWME